MKKRRLGKGSIMRCLHCQLTVADFWRWCPECGGQISTPPATIDLDSPPADYVVEWTVEGAATSSAS